MRMKISVRWVLGLLVVGMLIQAGAAVYALVADTDTSTSSEEASTTESMWNGPTQTTIEVLIDQAVLDKIKSSDPARYEANVNNYKKLLTVLDVHPKFKSELESLILDNHRLPDLLIAYEYLYHVFGTFNDIEAFVLQKESGKSWADIFGAYDISHASFVPQAFDSDELENWMNASGITSDDIMIADRIAFETERSFKEVLTMKLQSQSWKEVNAQLDIIYSASVLPRVQVTAEDIQNYTQSGKLTQDQVVEAFVLAYKIGEQPKVVIDQFMNGSKEETIFADSLHRKYDQ